MQFRWEFDPIAIFESIARWPMRQIEAVVVWYRYRRVRDDDRTIRSILVPSLRAGDAPDGASQRIRHPDGNGLCPKRNHRAAQERKSSRAKLSELYRSNRSSKIPIFRWQKADSGLRPR